MTESTRPLTVADAMRAATSTVSPQMTLPELEEAFVRQGVGGFPVVDHGMLVGVVSRTDVIKKICAEREVAESVSDFYYDNTGFHESSMRSLRTLPIASENGLRVWRSKTS